MLARDKRSGLLQKFVTYDRKKFYNIGPRLQKRGSLHTACKQSCIGYNNYQATIVRYNNKFFLAFAPSTTMYSETRHHDIQHNDTQHKNIRHTNK
jgi:hypothetical protein